MAKTKDVPTKETKKEAPPKLQLFGGDTVGFCDAETGICEVPGPVDVASTKDEPRKPKSEERVREDNKPKP